MRRVARQPQSLTPSLRRHRLSNVSLESFFDQCDELPGLLVAASVGSHTHYGTMVTYARVNKRFEREVREKVHEWCRGFKALQWQWIGTTVIDGCRSESFRHLIKMKRMLDGAFGSGFFAAYDTQAYGCSMYTPRSYVAMARRRCLICQRQLQSTATFNQVHPVGMGFVHHECQRKYCVARSGSCLPLEGNTGITHDPIRLGWHEDQPLDAFAAMIHYTEGAPGTTAELLARASPLVRINTLSVDRGNGFEDGTAVTLWLRPHKDVVSIEDTLMGTLGMDAAGLVECFRKARDRRTELIAERNERVRDIRQSRRNAVEERTADLRLAMGGSKMRWRKPEDVGNFHPNAWSISGVAEMLTPCRLPPAIGTVMDRLEFLDRMLGDPRLSRATVNFFLNDTSALETRLPLSVQEAETSVLPAIALQIDRLAVEQVCIESVRQTQYYLRVNSLTLWPSGTVRLAYGLNWNTVWLAAAHLEETGVDAPDLSKDKSPEELRLGLILLCIRCLRSEPCRGDAYELLGVHHALSQLVQHPVPEVGEMDVGESSSDEFSAYSE